jgi:hypothetical protein
MSKDSDTVLYFVLPGWSASSAKMLLKMVLPTRLKIDIFSKVLMMNRIILDIN